MMDKEMETFKKEREEEILKGKPHKVHVYFCQRCGKTFEEKVPESEGWQPFSLYPCKNCSAESASFIRYKCEHDWLEITVHDEKYGKTYKCSKCPEEKFEPNEKEPAKIFGVLEKEGK